jgi:organic hydroperoxide reductase OsmC/OhrA
MAQPDDRVYTTELIWDTGTDGTAIPREVPLRAVPLQIGPESGWLPAHLIALAAAGCFMSSLLRLAEEARVGVLGFVSNCRLRIPCHPSGRSTLVLEPCIVVASEDEVERMRSLCERAVRSSDICRMLEDRVHLEPDIQVLAGANQIEEP